MLTSKFEEIMMKNYELFDNFYAKLNGLANPSFNFGEKILDVKIVKNKKIMRSLFEWFRPKVSTIKESKDLDTMKVEELVGSLQTYKLTLPQPKKVSLLH